MSNFYDFMYGQNDATKKRKKESSKVVEDKAIGKKSYNGGYFVFCRDEAGTFKRLVEAIGKHGTGGHSYTISLEPDNPREKETFFWDGDGSDRIRSIIYIPEGDGEDNPLLRMCLTTLESINRMGKEMVRENEGFGKRPLTANEQRMLDNIIHDSHLILDGAKYDNNIRRGLENIKRYCENCLEGMREGIEEPITVQEVLEHIKQVATEGLEKGIMFNA